MKFQAACIHFGPQDPTSQAHVICQIAALKEMGKLSDITVRTPLYDPSGLGVPFLQEAANSVLMQEQVDFQWVISIQEVHPKYRSLLATLKRNPRVRLVEQSNCKSLSEHLTKLLNNGDTGSNHLLCHDDVYTAPNSLQSIVSALETADVLVVRPEVHDASGGAIAACTMWNRTPEPSREPRWHRYVESLGVNILGGLSTIAWKGSANTFHGHYDYFADLDLRKFLRSKAQNVCHLEGGFVCENSWAGQAQHWQILRLEDEARSWVQASRNQGSAVVATLTCLLLGNASMARHWNLSVPSRIGQRSLDLLGPAIMRIGAMWASFRAKQVNSHAQHP